jgi:hypothetical protein
MREDHSALACTAYDHGSKVGIQVDGHEIRSSRIAPVVREILRLHEVELKAITDKRGRTCTPAEQEFISQAHKAVADADDDARAVIPTLLAIIERLSDAPGQYPLE